MDEHKAAPQERFVLGILMIGTSLLGLSFVVGSRANLLSRNLGPMVGLARVLQLASLTAVVSVAALAISYYGVSGGLRMLGRELWPALLAGAAVGALLGVIMRAIFPPGVVWIAVLALYLGGVAFVVWVSQRASTEGGAESPSMLAALRSYLLPKQEGDVAQLQALRERLSPLPALHPTAAMVMGPGASAGQQLMEVIMSNCADAIQALETGRDPQGNQITRQQVGRGLGMLARDARKDAGVMLMSLDHDGFMEFQQLLDELDGLAAGLEKGVRTGGMAGARVAAAALLATVPIVIAAGGVYLGVAPSVAPRGEQVTGAPEADQAPEPPKLSGSLVYDGEVSEEQYRIFVLDLETGVETQLTNGVDNDFSPAWSPDGSRVAFTRWPVQTGAADEAQLAGDIYVMAQDGTGVSGIVVDDLVEWGSSWSPDGTKLLTTVGKPTDFYTLEVAVMGADGKDLVELTANGIPDARPEWSPDGSQIVFVSGASDDTHVMIVNADGSNAREVTPHPGMYSDPAWSPDGEHIAFLMGPGGGDGVLMVVDVGGSEMRELAAAAMPPVWSPDGDWLLFAHGTELRAVPYAGGQEVVVATFPHEPGSISWHATQ